MNNPKRILVSSKPSQAMLQCGHEYLKNNPLPCDSERASWLENLFKAMVKPAVSNDHFHGELLRSLQWHSGAPKDAILEGQYFQKLCLAVDTAIDGSLEQH